MTNQEKIVFDRNHLWHPYSGTISPRFCLYAKSAEGVEITLNDDRKLLDGISSWWCMAHGHRRPEIVEAMTKQLQTMPHMMFGGFTHDPAVELTEKLLKLAPSNLQKVFYSDSGSVACEVAMKMALQYFYAQERPEKSRFLTVANTYHGDTFATMALGDSEGGMHRFFSHLLTKHFIAPEPPLDKGEFDPKSLNPIREILAQNHTQIAALIIEPLLQGAGGMRVYANEYLQGLKALCQEFDVLLIADEIATGFGRLGGMFACSMAGVQPDIMCVGKALTGGHITLAATLCTNQIADTISSHAPNALMHGPTFMASPLSCAAARASLDLFSAYNYQERVMQIEAQLMDELEPLRALSGVKDIRVKGAMGAVELKQSACSDELSKRFVEKGCWLRPFGNIVYTMPPFVTSEQQLRKLTSAICEVVREQNC